MTPDRWKQVSRIYGAVLTRPESDRPAALADLCANDQELRREVESLLASGTGAALIDRAASDRPSVMAMANGVTIGSQIGVFRIDALLGVGGMGEVYRARDTKLNRDVAIKILPSAFARDPERLARFKREAQLLAALNHPNIAAIYGLEGEEGREGQDGKTLAIVMELVDGPTLADRIGKGALPVDEALPIARQIADALEAAHEQGIVHRDLKPANIKVRDDGTVKVLDFGLAKFADPTSPSPRAPEPRAALLSQSPTITTPAMTAAGMILGTAAYMSPEQAKGKPADKRSDIWAFGCVLFEMLSGTRAFHGDDVADTLAAVLRAEPNWTTLPAVPSRLAALLRRCLQKDRRQRLADIADVRFDLDVTPDGPPLAASSVSVVPARRGLRLSAVAALVALVSAVTGLVAWYVRPAVDRPLVARFSIPPAEDVVLMGTGSQVLAISPKGDRIVFIANNRLYVRNVNELETRPIPGTDVGGGVVLLSPVFSPDGRMVAYLESRPLASTVVVKQIPVQGGVASTISQVSGSSQRLSWTPEGFLLAIREQGIFRIGSQGGAPELIVERRADEMLSFPEMLPGGDALIFVSVKVNPDPPGGQAGRGALGLDLVTLDSYDRAQIVAQRMSGGPRIALAEGSAPRYLPTGHLLYAQAGSILAVPFDSKRLAVTGSAVPVIEGVSRNLGPPSTGAAHYDVASTGTLAYVPGPVTPSAASQQLTLYDRGGTTETMRLPPASYMTPRVSPDGKRLAYTVDDNRTANVYIYDLSGGTTPSQLTFDGKSRFPVWVPSSDRVIYQSSREGDSALFVQSVDGATPPRRLSRPEPGTADIPESVSSDSRTLAFASISGARTQLWYMSLSDNTRYQFPDTNSNVAPAASFSPDGKWVAYGVRGDGLAVDPNNTSATEVAVYVQPFPPTGAKYLITAYGFRPLWSRDGKELYFARRGQSYVTAITMAPTPKAGEPIAIPPTRVPPPGIPEREYDLMPNGRQLVFASPPRIASERNAGITVVLNWFDELKQKVPVR